MKRKHNEDSFILPDFERLAVVADGMGGHASGEVASNMAVEAVASYMKSTQDATPSTWPYKMDSGLRYDTNRLVVGIKHANQRIYETSQRNEEQAGMGTTIVSILFNDDRAIVAHVGDSRCYRMRRQQLLQLTEDHSLINDYIKMKRLSGEEVGRFQQKNVIVRALGMKESVQVDTLVDIPQVHDIYLICSDGLCGMIPDPQMAEILAEEPDLDHAVARLIDVANHNGGTDNITCILARLEPL